MVKPKKLARPMRSIAGGRSDRYLERRAGRGSERTYASDWNDAAASAALEAIQTEYQKSGSKTLLEYVIHLLSDEERVKDLAYRRCVGIIELSSGASTTTSEG